MQHIVASLTVVHSTIAYILLSPLVRFSAFKSDGSNIETALSLEDASFVNGLFIQQRLRDNSSTVQVSPNTTEFDTLIRSFNTVAGPPVALIVVSVYAFLVTAIAGYGATSRLKTRNEYRRALKEGKAAVPTVISWQ